MGMRSTVPDVRLDVPLRNLKYGDADGETARQKMTPPSGAMVEAAMLRARLEPKWLADKMGISPSFLLRGFKDQEQISWQRVKQVEHLRFQRELLAVQAEEVPGVVVRTVIDIPTEKLS